MKKKVRYNGGTESYSGRFTSPEGTLVKGQEYTLVYVDQHPWETDYYLAGVEGRFNSVWFTDVVESKHIYIAVAKEFPTIGQRLSCFRAEYGSHYRSEPKWISCRTTPVKEIRQLEKDVYSVDTNNSTYVVKVYAEN